MTSSESLIERLQQVHRCEPEIRKVSQEIALLTPDQYDLLVRHLTDRGLDHALGVLLIAAAINKIALNPVVLANAIKVVDVITDAKYPYDYQNETAIPPLLEVAQSEDTSRERQALAAGLAVELALKFSYPRQPVKKVLWQLLNETRAVEARVLLNVSLDLLEKGGEDRSFPFRLLGSDVFAALPAERPPVVIGDGGTVRRPVVKVGRNDPCRCGSGKKYKKCCYDADQERWKDASPYEGITISQLRDNPAVVNDASYIEGLRPYELKRLNPSRMNEDQLFTAYRQADSFGLRDLSFDMLLELQGRPGSKEFAIEHMGDLLQSALKARDMEVLQRILPHVPEEDRWFTAADKLRYGILENADRFGDLEALCRKAFVQSEDHHLLELSYAFEDIMPALSLVFARAAIVSEPKRWFDNEMLLDAIHGTRIALDLQPSGDPIEEYWDWIIGQNEERGNDQEKDEEIARLHEQLSQAREKSSTVLKDLREKEAALDALKTKVQKAAVLGPGEAAAQPVRGTSETDSSLMAGHHEEKRQEISTLRRKIDALKDQISEQQEGRRQLRQELQAAYAKLSKREPATTPEEEHGEELTYPLCIPEKVHIPEFTDAFRKSCEGIPPAMTIKALQAAVGFGARDSAVLRQAAAIERLPGYYRIRIGIHHRLMVRQTSKGTLQILEVIPRKQMDVWIRQHSL